MKKTAIKILNTLVTILIVLILIVSIFVIIVTFTANEDNGGVPNFFGKSPISVLSNSMQGDGELNFNKGDLLICDAVPEDARVNAKYKKGDVVCFGYDVNEDGYQDYVTHRIIKVNKDGTYITKGDNNDTYDQNSKATTVFPNIKPDDIVATYHGQKINGVGDFMDYLRTQNGFFFVILLPMIIFFLYTAVRVVINAMSYSKEKGMLKAQEAIANADLTDEQKEKAIAEYLAAQGAQSSDNNAKAEAVEEPEKEADAEAEAEPKSDDDSEVADEAPKAD